MGQAARKPAKSSVEKVKTSAPAEAKVSHEETLLDVKVADLRPGLAQYRRHFDETKIRALAESMKRLGQLDRLVVRKRKGGGYEIVSGERRWRAAKLIALPRLRCTLRDLTDEQAYEVAIAGNTQREDPHPLEECDGFVVLHDTYKRTVEQIAAKVNRPVGYVYERLALRDLGEAARKAMLEDRIGLGVARLLSRVRPEKVQAEALKEIVRNVSPPDRPSIGNARAIIERGYMLRLAEAPFDTKSTELVTKAGACTACPKNSATQGALFGEGFGSGALCTDSACWDGKVKADGDVRIRAAKAEGKTILSAAEVKQLFPHGDHIYSRELKLLDDRVDPHAYDGPKRSWRATLGKRLESVPVSVARLPSGAVVELARVADMTRAAKAAPLATDPAPLRPKAGPDPKVKASKEKAKRAAALSEALHERVTEIVVATVERGEKTAEVERMVLDVVLAGAPEVRALAIVKRRDITLVDDESFLDPARETLIRWSRDATGEQRRGLLVEILCLETHLGPPVVDEEGPGELLYGRDGLAGFVRAIGVDVEHCARAVEAELEEAEDQKKHGKRKPAKAEGEPVHTTKLRGPRKKKGEPPVVQPTLAEAYGPGDGPSPLGDGGESDDTAPGKHDPIAEPAGDDGEDW